MGRVLQEMPDGVPREGIWHSTYFTLLWRGWRGRAVVTVHDMKRERFEDRYDRRQDADFRRRKRRCLEQADAVICVSETTRADLLDEYRIDPATVHVVPNGVSEVFLGGAVTGGGSAVPAGAGTAARRPYLLYVGSRYQHKNFPRLLDAFARWPRRTEFALVVVGGGEWSAGERRELAAMGLTQSVELHAYAEESVLRDLYRGAACLVHPSLYEGFGLPVVEAMACGCPVVASRIPSTLEVAGDVPFSFDPDDTQSLLNAVDAALGEERASERFERGAVRARRFTWEETARGTLAVYRHVE